MNKYLNYKINILFLAFSTIISLYLFGRMAITFKDYIPEFNSTPITLINILMFSIAFIFIYKKLFENSRYVLFFLSYLLFYLFYFVKDDFSIAVIVNIFISLYLAKIYHQNKYNIFVLMSLSSVLYFFLLGSQLSIIEFGLLSMQDEIGRARNYIGSAVFIILISAFYIDTKLKYIIKAISLIILGLIKFRTGMLAFVVFLVVKYYKNINFYIFSIIFIFLFQYFIGFENILMKWEGESISENSRLHLWEYYIDKISNRFPENLFPVFIEFNTLYDLYDVGEKSGFTATHNIIIDSVLRMGILGGIIFLLFLLFPILSKSQKFKELKNFYISILVFAMLEPSVGFSTNLISTIFWMLLSYYYINIFKLKRGFFEKTINSYN
jgi:O-antigen ligase